MPLRTSLIPISKYIFLLKSFVILGHRTASEWQNTCFEVISYSLLRSSECSAPLFRLISRNETNSQWNTNWMMLQGFVASASWTMWPHFSEENPGHTLKTGRNEIEGSRGAFLLLWRTRKHAGWCSCNALHLHFRGVCGISAILIDLSRFFSVFSRQMLAYFQLIFINYPTIRRHVI